MMTRPTMRLMFLTLALLVFLAAATAVAAANTVPATALGDSSRAVGPNDLKPSACGGIYIENIIVDSGNINGTPQNDLILASSGVDHINMGAGDDCVMGGGGADDINGGAGDDVLIGGPDDDSLDGGQGTDSCYAAGGADTFTRCEAEYP